MSLGIRGFSSDWPVVSEGLRGGRGLAVAPANKWLSYTFTSSACPPSSHIPHIHLHVMASSMSNGAQHYHNVEIQRQSGEYDREYVHANCKPPNMHDDYTQRS